jgi:hypothetical protein
MVYIPDPGKIIEVAVLTGEQEPYGQHIRPVAFVAVHMDVPGEVRAVRPGLAVEDATVDTAQEITAGASEPPWKRYDRHSDLGAEGVIGIFGKTGRQI